MGEVHRLPHPGHTEREASDWFARMNADDVTSEDRSRFEAWLSAHSLNAKAYAELCATWKELQKSGPLVRAVNFGQAMNAASTAPWRPRRWLAGALAASVGVIVLAVGWNLYKQKEESRFQTAVGEQAAVALPDGSSFDLNTNSRVQVDYSQHSRVIHLERGEAFFKVAHDTKRPFWVHAGDRWVRAVGTAFNVYLRPTGVEVTVSEGTVNVVNATAESPPADTVDSKFAAAVTAGEQADAQGRADVIRALNSAQLSRLLAWRKSSLYFQDEPLGDVVNELMRYTTLKIEIVDDSLRSLPVGGTFQASPEGAEALLTTLQDGFGTQIRRADPGHVYIEGPAR
ncbi:MAG TPA: FecR domain-containing protein [Steroidobacteraceae bacterium]|nr:FecR domain-containing protein [Steroidobacteraceae bacterium]